MPNDEPPMRNALLLTALLVALAWNTSSGADKPKEDAFRNDVVDAPEPETTEKNPGGAGHRILLTNGSVQVPVVVVRGTPYQMGWHLGRLMRDEIRQFVPAAVAGFKKELQ